MMPTRIQRRRTKGWTMPEGAVYVGRPSKWGNPFHTHGDGYAMAPKLAVECFRKHLREGAAFFPNTCPKPGRLSISRLTTVEDIKRELRGKDLACWCPLGQSCHADVLLEIANA